MLCVIVFTCAPFVYDANIISSETLNNGDNMIIRSSDYKAETINDLITELEANKTLIDYLRGHAVSMFDVLEQIAVHLVTTDTDLVINF